MIKDVRQTAGTVFVLLEDFLSTEGVNQSDFSGSLFETAWIAGWNITNG
jgi:hypothetical protein